MNSPNRISEFDFMLSEEDYQRLLKNEINYQQVLNQNIQLEEELKAQKLKSSAIENELQKSSKDIIKMAKKLILMEEEKDQLLEELERTFSMTKTRKISETEIETNKKVIETLTKQLTEYEVKENKLKEENNKFELEIQEIRSKNQEYQLKIEQYQSQIQKIEQEIQEYKHKIESQKHENAELKGEICNLNDKNINAMKENDKLKCEQNEIEEYTQKITNKITEIIALLQIGMESTIEDTLSMIESSELHINPVQENEKEEQQNKETKINPKEEEKYQSILMDEEWKSNLSFIEQGLNEIKTKVFTQTSDLRDYLCLKELNKNLEASNESLTKRMKYFEEHMTSELNLSKVIETKYQGMKEAMNTNEDVVNAMEDLISKYHEALDTEYAKILHKTINN